MIRPIPNNIGVGFFSMEEKPEYAVLGYRSESVGRYWNYHFTTKAWKLPLETSEGKEVVIDGFSPNLNKELHIGHLRNLAIANSIIRFFDKGQGVSMLGAAVGIEPGAQDRLDWWLKFVGYSPKLYYDNQLPDNVECTLVEGGPSDGCKVWMGPKGPVIVCRSDGRPTYAHHDLSFANVAKPTHYITGAEQKEHFESLGFGGKHLPMGLVLGADGKKISSREGNSMSAMEALERVSLNIVANNAHVMEESARLELAWNVIAWNFLHTNRIKNVIFNPEQWTKIDSPGMYISYTYARVFSALKNTIGDEGQITDKDLHLLGTCSYFPYYMSRAIDVMDPSPIANYAFDLAKIMTICYHAEYIQNGRPGFQFAMRHAHNTLGKCMNLLGMKELQKI